MTQSVVSVGVKQTGEVTEGWGVQLAAVFNLSSVEGVVVVLCCGSDGVVFWGIGLDDSLSSVFSSSCSSRYLAEELKGALAGSEVGQG